MEGKVRSTIYEWENNNEYTEDLRTKLRAIIDGDPVILAEINSMEDLKFKTQEFLKNIDRELRELWKAANRK